MEITNRYTARLYGCIHLLRSYVGFIWLSCLCGNKDVSHSVCQQNSSICWQGTQSILMHTLHSPKRQTPRCRSRQFGSAPSWCWTRHPECPAGTADTHTEPHETSSKTPFMLANSLVFTALTLTTSSPSIILSFSRFSFRSSGRVLHLSSPSRPTREDRHLLIRKASTHKKMSSWFGLQIF